MTSSFDAPKSPEQQLQPGLILVDRYAIQEVIGVGGMGSVYRARDLHFPNVAKYVAVKEMINQARDPVIRQTIVQNFEREANILVTLDHPSIPHIYDYFTRDNRSYLVIEYIHGKDLELVLNDNQGFLPEDLVVGWAIELCDVLEFLHSHKPEPIIFRDMKPSNVMVDQHNHVYLVDFGIAKVFRTGQKGTMIGTEGYSPPEQYRGEASPLADVYALGATMHHLLTKHDPRLEAPFTFAERPVRKANPTVSLEIETVVQTALKYPPEERFQSAKLMKEALLSAARKTGILSKINVPGTATTSSQTSAVKPLWIFKSEDEIRGSLAYDNGIIYYGAYDNNLYALNAADGSFAWKFPTEGGIVSRPVIQDGIVYFGSGDKKFYAVSARSGKLIWSYYTDGAIHSSPRIAEGHIFIGSDDNCMHAVNLSTSRRVWRVEVSGQIRSTPAIFGEHIYFGCDSGEFYCVGFGGVIKWRFMAKRALTSSPLISQGVIFVASLDAQVYSLDTETGWVIWRFRMGKGSISSPCKVDNAVILGSADGLIYAIDATSARELWRFQTGHQVSGSPAAYHDSIYCGSADGHIYCLESKTGRLRWKFKTEGPITGTPLIFNDILYIGSFDHTVYALHA
jgi:serine/threonine protein kinase